MKNKSLGVVVIGRNEGKRLQKSLKSIVGDERIVVYVDSGSTDGSVDFAKSLGVYVVKLDLSIPFTAARARNAGFEYLLKINPEIEFVQFIDGDCQVVEGWLEIAEATLINHVDVLVVCGRRREINPYQSIYNLLCDIEWCTPVGEVKACGGDAMMRVTALKQVGGFNPQMIAGEEPELCVRLREIGGKILRIDAEMTRHDAQISSFAQWWKRCVRNGYAYAEGAWLHGQSSHKHWVKESRMIWVYGLVLPLLALSIASATQGLSIGILLVANIYLGLRVYKFAINKNFAVPDAMIYGLFCVLDKFPMLQGQIQFHRTRLLKRQPQLVEYK
ncbi:glycosyltransferase [Calothrix sp. 336/3]|uniref:glycosyltransferase n=1 Tax=Calothrix sp. 336/3 TaxID=1337936 RepID=UPI0004E405AB|nr:glycosyltransferase [Calothrix sp. 336/3]AKG22775.1 glycosyl transferase [Calothrix sp. 336/3]